MSSTEHLDNFPFLNMSEFNSAFKNGLAEPVVPSEFARKWATKDKFSSVKLQVTIFNGLVPTLSLVLIIYLTLQFEELRWYHSLGAMVICFFAFSPNLSKTFKTISALLSLIATIYLYFTNSPYAYLIGLSFIPIFLLASSLFSFSKNCNQMLIMQK